MPSATPGPDPGPAPIRRVSSSSGASRPLLIAHRCGAGLGPENTCGAVVQSSFYRPDYYEIDIRHTADGVPVCLHDETLDRTTDRSGPLEGFTWTELQAVDAGVRFASTYIGEPIPTFERMLDCVNPSPLAIELKEDDISVDRCRALARLLAERDEQSSVVLSFHRAALESFREADPTRRTGYLAVALDDYALQGEHEFVGLAAWACDPEAVERLHQAGKGVWVWTVNEGFERFIEMGVDGIVTDYPDRLRAALAPS